MNVPYIPGTAPPPELPLGRFLPPIPGGMIRNWCRENLKPGEWVLEPFGFNPLVPIEIATTGHPVLVTVNNPIHAFMLQVLASAPQHEELIAALQDLAVTPKGDDRMEPYIRSLYHVNCTTCGSQIEADAFLWKKEADQPFASQVECPFCGASGEQTLNDETLASMTPLPPMRLHQARALNRIADLEDSLRSQVENALNAYPDRPLIILQTIINKFESLEQTPRRRELLIALILSAADQGNTLWAYPSPRNRPRQLVIPPVFQERNLWKVMEEAVKSWQVLEKPVPVSDWHGDPLESNGIFRFQGRIKELNPAPPDHFFAAIVAALPRPNQAFWTLSALWTGWIWGQEAIAPIRQVLSRQRYDWNWHTNALSGVFNTVLETLHPSQKFWGLITENEPMLLLAVLLAADSAGYKLTAFAQSTDDQVAQCQWEPDLSPTIDNKPGHALGIARQKITEYLRQKGEPASYQMVHTAAVTGLAHETMLAEEISPQSSNISASETQKWIEKPFQEEGFLTRVAGGTASLDTGEWWLVNPAEIALPLIDRVEEQIVRHLVSVRTTSAEAVKLVVYQSFPGIFTPEDSIILTCLESYADLMDPKDHLWELREYEQPAARRADIAAIQESLKHIALRLDYHVSGQAPLLWYEKNNKIPSYSFHVFSSAIFSKHIYQGSQAAQTNIFVFPGSRANLLAFKKQRDPVLRQTLDRDFLFLKFRLVRDLEANPLLSRDLFEEQILADPPEYYSSQLALF